MKLLYAALVEERGDERPDVVEDLALERLGLGGDDLDAAGERAQHEDGGELGGRPGVGAAEAAAAVERSPSGSRRGLSRSSSGAVTIALRSCTSATLRVSTAVRLASNSSPSTC